MPFFHDFIELFLNFRLALTAVRTKTVYLIDEQLNGYGHLLYFLQKVEVLFWILHDVGHI